VVVLACTHFPLLREELGREFGPDVVLIDGAEGIARRIADLTKGQEFARSGPDRAITTGSAEYLESLREPLTRHGLGRFDRF